MNPRIIRALIHKEGRRYWHNRPSLVLAVLLILVSLLVSAGQEGGPLAGRAGDAACIVLYWRDDALVQRLKSHPPRGRSIKIVPASEFTDRHGVIQYPRRRPNEPLVSIQIRPGDDPAAADPVFRASVRPDAPPKSIEATGRGRPGYTGRPGYCIWYWYTDGAAEALHPYRTWFNAELRACFGNQPAIAEAQTEMYSQVGPIKPIHRVMTALVAAAVYLICFHLHILIAGEEKERKTLLAQMLAPVSVRDLLAAKICFYVPATLALAGLVVAVNYPAALVRPLFWFSLASACVAYLSIGLIICSLTSSQSAAGLTALAYLMLVGVTTYLAAIIPIFSKFSLLLVDYHLLQLIHYSVIPKAPRWAWPQAALLAGLAGLWAFAAARVFTRRGWR